MFYCGIVAESAEAETTTAASSAKIQLTKIRKGNLQVTKN
jgi:hypothetical protein